MPYDDASALRWLIVAAVLGFGTAAQGATFTQIAATDQWQIHSGLDGHNETITFSNHAHPQQTDVLFG